MEILVVGAGVIGTVYGAQLAAAGHGVSVLAHRGRTDELARDGLRARDVLADLVTDRPVRVVDRPDAETFDLVLVALRHDHLLGAATQLTTLSGQPLVLFFGNNLDGRAGLPSDVPGAVYLGFPGVGGTITAGVAQYVVIAQQPTALEQTSDARLHAFAQALETRGLAVQRVADMSGWLAYHAVFVASISAALYHCRTDPQALARNRRELRRMCRAITQGFRALRHQGVAGLPRNLAVLHAPALEPVAARYWARSMRSPMGELAFAAHSRHAEPEMRALAHDVVSRVGHENRVDALRELLTEPG